ncbi:histidine kinase [Micromonospora sp. NPDC049374]|uniref:sensor histidine kinase n=1 Tax=Micromonospora sp. NPDC049374 TaxID=3154352 RepID=UPI00344055E5
MAIVEVRNLLRRYALPVLAVLVSVGVWMSANGAAGVASPLPRAVVLAVVVASGTAVAVARVRRWPLFAAAAVAWPLLAAWPVPAAASLLAGLWLRGRRRIVAYLAGAVLVTAIGVLVGWAAGGHRQITMATPGNVLALFAWLVLLPLVIGLWTRARRDTVGALRDRAERLEREQVARMEQARAEERARIAREMHDVVAHRVSLMVVHAGALEVTSADSAAVETASLIRSTGRQALADLREVLGVLRGAAGPVPPQGLSEVDVLIQESRTAGLRIDRQDEGIPRPLPATVGRTVHRVVREALTNVRKHAPDAETTVSLRYLSSGVEVGVRNGPAIGGAALPGAGLGLIGLRERVELLGGRLTAGPYDEGFLVRALLPTGEPE